jgi:hypothetical protein
MFWLNPGLATFKFSVTLNPQLTVFQAYLYDSDGNSVGIVANSISDTSIINRQQITTSGNYYIETNTQDGWDITVTE